MRFITVISIAFLLISGCAKVQDFGSNLKLNIQGEFYLQQEDFDGGLTTFGRAVVTHRNSPEAHFYLGRFHLAKNNLQKALVYLQQTVDLDPLNSSYHFWLGVAYGEAGKEILERQSYTTSLELDPENLQAMVYLGNNLLRAKQYNEALVHFQQALKLDPLGPQPLYNRSVILRKIGRTPEEKIAWRHYLDAYPSGAFAKIAADRLNVLGDDEYRNHILGIRTVTLSKIHFEPFSHKLSNQAYPSLNVLGALASNVNGKTLNVVVYQLNNIELARQRAKAIGGYLKKHFPKLKGNDSIRLSWFGVAEKRTVMKKQIHHDESVQFFLTNK